MNNFTYKSGGQWRPLAQYLVSRDGRVKNAETGRVLSGYIHQSASAQYRRVKLTLHGRVVRIFVHRLVAIMWGQPPTGIGIETPGNLPNVPEINHLDGNTFNNHVENLEWIDSKGNKEHSHWLRACRAVGLLDDSSPL
jgi:hypothetical protein